MLAHSCVEKNTFSCSAPRPEADACSIAIAAPIRAPRGPFGFASLSAFAAEAARTVATNRSCDGASPPAGAMRERGAWPAAAAAWKRALVTALGRRMPPATPPSAGRIGADDAPAAMLLAPPATAAPEEGPALDGWACTSFRIISSVLALTDLPSLEALDERHSLDDADSPLLGLLLLQTGGRTGRPDTTGGAPGLEACPWSDDAAP